MNRSVKIFAVIALIAIILVCFTGCSDNADDKIVLSSDRECLTYNGNKYIKLEKDAGLFVVQMQNRRIDGKFSVEQEGVPSVLTGMFKSTAYYNNINDLFMVDFWHVNQLIIDPAVYEPPREYYCSELDHEVYMDAMENAVADRIGFEYAFTSPDGDGTDLSFVLGILSEEASSEIIKHIENPIDFSKETFEEVGKNPHNAVDFAMYICDESAMLAERLDDYDICKNFSSEAYLINKTTKEAVKLSKATALNIQLDHLNYVGYYGSKSEDTKTPG